MIADRLRTPSRCQDTPGLNVITHHFIMMKKPNKLKVLSLPKHIYAGSIFAGKAWSISLREIPERRSIKAGAFLTQKYWTRLERFLTASLGTRY
jgi:hypothetical protein